ncbi:MAG: hypothetical protein ABL930_03735 [Pseudobdellovibrio sp.]
MKNFISILLSGFLITTGPRAFAVNSSPKIVKTFNPSSININEFVTMTIAFSNPGSEVANFTAPFSESLPEGVIILGFATTTCGGTLIAQTGSSKFSLVKAKIPAFAACQIMLGVTATKAGNFTSKTPAAALQTDKGSNLLSSSATLTVIKYVPVELRIIKSFKPSVI